MAIVVASERFSEALDVGVSSIAAGFTASASNASGIQVGLNVESVTRLRDDSVNFIA